jgi:hypothetical protein
MPAQSVEWITMTLISDTLSMPTPILVGVDYINEVACF